MKRRIPEAIDLSDLQFLRYGDKEIIKEQLKKEGWTKVTAKYVSEVCRGLHRNDRILKKAFELAYKRKADLPSQALRAA